MIDVVVFSGDERVASAEAEDPESALLAARTLWDEAFNSIMGQRRRIDFWTDGTLVRSVTERP